MKLSKVLIIFLSFVFVFCNTKAQDDKFVKKALELLKDYRVQLPKIEKPTKSVDQLWQDETEKYIEDTKGTIQYCSNIIAFSSQYSDGNWSASQVIGVPNVYPYYGDHPNAWTSSTADGQREFLELGFNNPMPISNIAVYETFNCGSVDTIYVKNPNTGNWEIVYQGVSHHITTPRIFEVSFPLTSFPVSQIRLAIDAIGVPGWNEIDAVAIADEMINPFIVNIMPSYGQSQQYANAIINQNISVWGNIKGGLPPYSYSIDFGDGTDTSDFVSDMHYIGVDHIYSTAGVKTVKLTVTDDSGLSIYKEAQIRVFAAPTQQVKVNIAIEKGLLFLYKNQTPAGHWYGEDYLASTGMAVLSFEENGHLPTNNYNEDIYSEYVRRGLDYILSNAYWADIYPQTAGNPDSDGDGKGVYLGNGSTYPNGIGFLAILGAHRNAESAKVDTIRSNNMAGHSYYDVIVDVVDQIAFSQTDENAGSQRGGWRYYITSENQYSSDNSAVQWPSLVLEAAQNNWGIAIPQFVKNELKYWLIYSQDAEGGFGYTQPWEYINIAKTGAGIGCYALLDYTSDSLVIQNALNYSNNHWYDTNDPYGWRGQFFGNLYALYGMAKGLRIINHRVGISNVHAHNWYEEYVNFLLTDPTWKQNELGAWTNAEFFGSQELSTGFAVLVLTQGVVIPPPVAVIDPIAPHPINSTFQVFGNNSYHQDPSKSIIEWKWDWDANNGINWDDPNALGPNPINPGYADSGKYVITLRVKDNSTPPMYDTETYLVTINDTTQNHPPVAVAIPPNMGAGYAGKIGEPILLDGTYSYDPDYPRDSVIVYKWDTNGDGIFGDYTTPTVTLVFNNEYQGQVGLRVYDTHGDSSSNVSYINVVASRKDLLVKEFILTSSSVKNGRIKAIAEEIPIIPGDTLYFYVVLQNDPTSNTDVNNVLVRFYDENPLTIGNRLGDDYIVNLPIGQEAIIDTKIEFPNNIPGGLRNCTVFLDPLQQVDEWNEVNNLASKLINVVKIIKPDDLVAQTPQIGQVSLTWIDRSKNETGFEIQRKLGNSLSVDTFKVIGTVGENINNYMDENVEDSTLYTYRVRAFNLEDYSEFSNEVSIKTLFTDVEEINIPTSFSISQNYPNPFNPATIIKYSVPTESKIKLTIYNVLGETVNVLKDEVQKAGFHEITWNAKDLASGVYFVEMNAESKIDSKKFSDVKKMTLLK